MEKMTMKRTSEHCSLSERAFTDLITNATFFRGIDLRKDFKDLQKIGGFPRESLPSVLHESVHHWCFMTPVGSALSWLKIRSQIRSLEWAVHDDDAYAAGSFDDNLRFEVTTRMLRPLTEGMALFAEYDIMPYPDTPVISKPMEWAYFFFTAPTKKELDESYGFSLLKLLGETRLTEEMIRRKTNLLVQPLDCSAGGYLPGYLAVKSLWRAVRERNNSFYDADLFNSLLRRYIYGDYGFVQCILNPELNGGEWIVSMIAYIQDRIDGLLQLDLKRVENELIETTLNPVQPQLYDGIIRLSDYPPISTSKDIAAQGLRLLEELNFSMRETLEDTALADVTSSLSDFQMQPLGFRHLLWLGQMDVNLQLSRNDGLSVYLNGIQLFEEQLLVAPSEVPEKATLDLYVSVYENFIGITVSDGAKMLAVRMLGAPDDQVRERFRDLGVDRLMVEKLQEGFNKAFETLADVFKFGPILDGYLEKTDKFIEEIYCPAAMLYVDREDQKICWNIMRKDGLLGMLENNLSLLKVAAALSVAASLRMHPEEVAESIPEGEISFEKALALLEGISNDKGFPMVFGRPGLELAGYI